MWLFDSGAGFLNSGGRIYSQLAGRPIKRANKEDGFIFAASFEGAVIEQQINPFPLWLSTFWSVFYCV